MAINNGLAIRAAQLRAQIGAVKLEKKGFRRRGRSLSAMLKPMYDLPMNSSHDTLLELLQEELALTDATLLATAEGEPTQ